MLLIYFGFFGCDWILEQLTFFQFVGSLFFLIIIVPEIIRGFKKILKSKQKVDSEWNWIVWPEDAETFSAEKGPLSLRSITGKVKLYKMEQMVELLAEFSLGFKKSVFAARALRYTNPTIFTLNVLFLCFVGIVFTSYFSGRTNLLILTYLALLVPGFVRRQLFEKIVVKLERSAKGKVIVRALSIGDNPNLQETNSTKVFSFVNNCEVQKRKLQKMKVTEVKKPMMNQSQRFSRTILKESSKRNSVILNK